MNRRKSLDMVIAVCVFLAALAAPAAGRTIYVDPNGSADFTTIQAAIDDPCTLNGDQIEAAPGTYGEAINFNGKAVGLYSSGGPDVTTIDGTGHYHVVQCISGEDANTILDGFTITGGNAKGAGSDAYGGGMCNNGSSPTVTNCTFTGNSASTGGGMLNYRDSSNPTVTNCTFSDNSAADYGGGMYNLQSSPTVTDCNFSGNSTDWNGGGIYNYNSSSPTVTNCILWGDTPDEIYNSSSSPVVTYCDVQGGYGGPDANNINADPYFVNAGGGNLRLLLDSPCIDAADNNSVPADTADLDGDGNTVEPIPLDLNGFPRFIDDLCTGDSGKGTPPIVDMGAYEFLPADIDGSGAVDLRDLCEFALHWGRTGCGRCGGADLTCDGDVDWNDLRELTDWWLAGK